MDRGHGAPGDVARVVALGASNLTRGFQTVVSTARSAWGKDVQVVAALGHGRSYGADSTFLFRRLPAILRSEIWRQLESTPAVPTRALVTDIGNDIVYGFPPEQILAWIDEALTRLTRVSDDVVLTDLPMDNIRRLSPAKFHVVRSVFFPSCRLSFAALVATAEQVNAGLAELAGAHRARFLHLEASWYGFDPIHIRPSLWPVAWQEVLGISCPIPRLRTEALRLYAMRPEQQWVFGVEQRTPQTGVQLPRGARLWLY
jgi:hypothetical protein